MMVVTRTVSGCVELSLRSRWAQSRDQERTHARALLAGSLLPRGGLSRDPGAVTPSDLVAVARALSSRGLGPASVNRHVAALRSALRAGVEEGWFDRVPAWRALHEPRAASRERAPTQGEVELIVRHSASQELQRLVGFLWRTGCRLGEALSAGSVALSGGHPTVTFRRTKNGSDRAIPLDPAHSHEWPPFRISRSALQREWVRARRAAGIGAWFTPHSLRHGRVTALLTAGVPVPTVAAYVGHRDWRTTARYAHPGAGDLLACVQVV